MQLYQKIKDALASAALDPDAFVEDVLGINSRQPPLELELRTGFHGIAGQYKLPEGLTITDIEPYVRINFHRWIEGRLQKDKCLEALQEIWSAIKVLNHDSLQSLRVDEGDPRDLFDATLGVTSAFNVQDIQSFIDGNSGTVMRKDFAWDSLYHDLKYTVGDLSWVPTMGTLELIRQQRDEICARKQTAPGNKKQPAPKTPKM